MSRTSWFTSKCDAKVSAITMKLKFCRFLNKKIFNESSCVPKSNVPQRVDVNWYDLRQGMRETQRDVPARCSL